MDWNEEINSVADWMFGYADSFNIEGYVVGLSGGIDSSVTACEAVLAVGKENVIGIGMPCGSEGSNPDSVKDAKLLAENLGIRFGIMDIEKQFNDTVEAVEKFLEIISGEKIKLNRVTKANIKARIRMANLYAVANFAGYLVAGTGNLSELEVGYCTKHGDGGVDIEPLGNYYKTEIYKMAEYMPEIPQRTKAKAPSADLWKGQTDEQELGMTYAELDEALKAIKGGKSSLLDTVPIERVEKVQKMKKGAIHKNNPPPRYIRRYVAVS